MNKHFSHLKPTSILSIQSYAHTPLVGIYSVNPTLMSIEFEKKTCRSAFKKEFGNSLPGSLEGELRVSVGRLNKAPLLRSSRWPQQAQSSYVSVAARLQSKNKFSALELGTSGTEVIAKEKSLACGSQTELVCSSYYFKQRLHKRSLDAPFSSTFTGTNLGTFAAFNAAKARSTKEAMLAKVPAASNQPSKIVSNKVLVLSGVQLLSSDWFLELLIQQLKVRRSARAAMNSSIRDIEALMGYMQSSCPVQGVRITATGRLGKKKKGMAQQLTQSVGKVPLITARQKIDYSQGFVTTSLGVIGLKIWVSYVS